MGGVRIRACKWLFFFLRAGRIHLCIRSWRARAPARVCGSVCVFVCVCGCVKIFVGIENGDMNRYEPTPKAGVSAPVRSVT